MNVHVKVQQMRRAKVEEYIEELIALLDVLDGDPDLEDNNDAEPSIGNQGRYINGKLEYDLEDDASDDEPNLGWSEYQSITG